VLDRNHIRLCTRNEGKKLKKKLDYILCVYIFFLNFYLPVLGFIWITRVEILADTFYKAVLRLLCYQFIFVIDFLPHNCNHELTQIWIIILQIS